MNMKQRNKQIEEEARVSKESVRTIELGGSKIKSNADVRREKEIICTVNQLLTFSLDITDARKLQIVKGQIPSKEPRDYTPWFTRASGAIKKSIIANDKSHIYQKIAELKNFEIDFSKRNEKHDVPNSLEMLNRFLQLNLPEPFNHLTKEKVRISKKSCVVNGVAVKVTPDIVFSSKINGTRVIGAVKLITRIGDPLGALQRKMGAYFVHECLLENQDELDGEILPELCVFIDVYHKHATVAPDRTSVPSKDLRKLCSEYSNLFIQQKSNQK
jgi:hypothetical protein